MQYFLFISRAVNNEVFELLSGDFAKDSLLVRRRQSMSLNDCIIDHAFLTNKSKREFFFLFPVGK